MDINQDNTQKKSASLDAALQAVEGMKHPYPEPDDHHPSGAAILVLGMFWGFACGLIFGWCAWG